MNEKIEFSLPKENGRCSVQREWKQCGCPGCRCQKGQPHGPFYSLRWREGNRQRRAYLRRHEVPAMLLRIAEARAAHPPASHVRAALRTLCDGLA